MRSACPMLRCTNPERKGLNLVVKDLVNSVRVKLYVSSSISSPWNLNWDASYKLNIPCTSFKMLSLKFPALSFNWQNTSVSQVNNVLNFKIYVYVSNQLNCDEVIFVKLLHYKFLILNLIKTYKLVWINLTS